MTHSIPNLLINDENGQPIAGNGQPTGYSFTYSSNQNSSMCIRTDHIYGNYNSNTIIPSGYGTVEGF